MTVSCKIKKLPSNEELHQALEYRDGALYWKNREVWPPSHNTRFVGKKAGNIRKDGYIRIRFKGVIYRAHRLIYKMATGLDPNYIDHVDGDPSNNRVENLRNCTQSENQKNRKLSKDNNSGFKGVSWYKDKNKWRVVIRINGKTKHLGYFDDIEEAAKAYKDMALKTHGEFYRAV